MKLKYEVSILQLLLWTDKKNGKETKCKEEAAMEGES